MPQLSAQDVTLYVPVSDCARTLPATLATIAQQTARPADVMLVVNMRCTDGTVEIARESGLRVVEQHRGRLGHARNLAIEHAETPWLASCDADVELAPDWLEALVSAADERVAAVGGRTEEHLRTPADRWRAVNMPHNWGPLAFDNPYMVVSEMLARVDALRSIGGYRDPLRYGEDSDLCERLRQAGYTLRYTPSAVARHDRADAIEQVLDLRWDYSLRRQRSRLESLSGLTEKLAINRVYALQSLSQTLHSDQAETCAISIMLWFHHALRDLQAALAGWPLIDRVDARRCVALLDTALTSCLHGAWDGLRVGLSLLQTVLDGAIAACEQIRRRGDSLAATNGFRAYLDAAHIATHELLEALPNDCIAAVISSAQRLAGSSDDPFPMPSIALRDIDRMRIEQQTLRPAWDWEALMQRLQEVLLDAQPPLRPVFVGRHVDSETGNRPIPTSTAGSRIAFVPHLECVATPRETLATALAEVDAAVVSYRTPTMFCAGVPVLAARDLATTAVKAGMAIRIFETEAGRTLLILERPTPQQPAAPDHADVSASASHNAASPGAGE